jgi:type IV fimbrial biogenesis protein FimT
MSTKQTGFTLIELMVTIAVLGILVSIAVPSYQNMVLGNRIVAQANQVVTALNYARSEAVKRGATAIVCASNGGTSCSGITNWTTGWLVFADANGNGTVDNGELLRVWPALTGGNTLNAGSSKQITFAATGFTSPAVNDIFRLCDSRGPTNARAIVINAMGRSYVTKGTASCP